MNEITENSINCVPFETGSNGRVHVNVSILKMALQAWKEMDEVLLENVGQIRKLHDSTIIDI